MSTYVRPPELQEFMDQQTARIAAHYAAKEKEKLVSDRVKSEVPPPNVGDTIYVGTQIFLDHGEDDVAGGLATVKHVQREGRHIFVEVVEHPGRSYNWECLGHVQDRFKAEYGDQRAHPDPDLHPSANEGRIA